MRTRTTVRAALIAMATLAAAVAATAQTAPGRSSSWGRRSARRTGDGERRAALRYARTAMKHQHVPQFYLKAWAGSDGNVICYKRTPAARVHDKPVAPKGTAFEPDLYAAPPAFRWPICGAAVARRAAPRASGQRRSGRAGSRPGARASSSSIGRHGNLSSPRPKVSDEAARSSKSPSKRPAIAGLSWGDLTIAGVGTPSFYLGKTAKQLIFLRLQLPPFAPLLG
jgi:hypothetical protein